MWRQRKLFSRCFYSLCALFVVGALVYDFYRPHSEVYEQLSQENLSIDQALEQILTCTSVDRTRQRALLYTLQEWTHFAEQHHIQYWIAYGTLVGYVQRHGLLPHDHNIDLFIMAQDTSSLVELSQLNFSSIYKLRVHPQWYIVEQTKRSYFNSEGINFIKPNARFVNSQDRVTLNIWPIYDYNPSEGRMVKRNKTMLTSYDKNYQWRSSFKEWTFPLRECQFSGIKVWCPAEPERLVVDIYGEISINMSSITCVNGSWVKSDEYISAEEKINMNAERIGTEESKPIDTTLGTTTDYLNNLELIEKALEDIPTCNADDRPRQRILLTAFQAWAKLAEKYNLQYWIACGTLIGYVQRRGLLPHDFDIDVTMMTDDIPKLIEISKSNFSSKYKIRIQPQWNIVGYENRSYFPKKRINFVAPNARFIDQQSGDHVDIFPAYNFNPLYSTNSTTGKRSKIITEYTPRYDWLSYPRNWTYPLQICYFSEIQVLCPAQPEKLVEAMYNEAALTKSDTKCVNGSWVDNVDDSTTSN